MKGKKLLFWIMLVAHMAMAQSPGQTTVQSCFQAYNQDLSWVKLQPEIRLTANSFFEQTYSLYGLESPADMQLIQEFEDKFGWTHYRFHQFHRGIKVEGASYILHEKEGKILKGNGNIIPDLTISTHNQISPEQALNTALRHHPATSYKWENPTSEANLKHFTKNPSASYAPKPVLTLIDPNYPHSISNPILAYSMEIYAEEPLEKHQVWINAITGNQMVSINKLYTNNSVEGTAITKYYGEQKIMTKQNEEAKFILADDTRGEGVFTFNGMNFYFPQMRDFEDYDNYWNNFNDKMDEVATDAHFGAAATYDFFKDNFGWSSYDNEDSPVVTFVHFREDYNNAIWDGNSINIGDGDGVRFNPLTTIDIIGHEFSHGVTENSSSLIYAYESGALNESFSDIFGKAIEYSAAPEQFTWVLGRPMLVDPNNKILRDLSKPEDGLQARYYQGKFWRFGEFDDGGVHYNSGVQSYWFYLLCEGEQGVNEAGEAYDVPAIGMDKAVQIAFRNLTVYLNENSDYFEARRGSLEACADLYGFCSEEYYAVAAAWHAVGVGSPIVEMDFQIFTDQQAIMGCAINDQEVKVRLINNSCGSSLAPGTTITMAYQVNEGAPVYEDLILSQSFAPSQLIEFSFSNTISDFALGNNQVKVWFEFAEDVNAANNESLFTVENNSLQNSDFALLDVIPFPLGRRVCEDVTMGNQIMIARVEYRGCETLEGFAGIPYQITYEDQSITGVFEDNFTNTLEPFDGFPIWQEINLEELGFGQANFSIDYPGDVNADNNTKEVTVVRTATINRDWIEDFSGNTVDSNRMAILSNEKSLAQVQNFMNDEKFFMSGSSIFNEAGDLDVIPVLGAELFFFQNQQFHSYIDLCPELVNLESPKLSFDLVQTRSNLDYANYGIRPEYAAMVGVLINGVLLEDIILGQPDDLNAVHYEFNFDDYNLPDFYDQVQIVSLALQADYNEISEVLTLKGDNNIIDNIEISYDDPTSVIDPSLGEQISVYPNPSSNSFQLELNTNLDALELQIFNPQGQLLEQHQLDRNTFNFEFGQNLIPGLYILKIRENQRISSLKLIKQAR